MPEDVGTGSNKERNIYDREEFTCLVCDKTYFIPEEERQSLVKTRMIHPSVVCKACSRLAVSVLDKEHQDMIILLLGNPQGRESLWNLNSYDEAVADVRAKAARRHQLEQMEICEMTIAEISERYDTWGEEVGKLAEEYRRRVSKQP